jgi:hypothetical protein
LAPRELVAVRFAHRSSSLTGCKQSAGLREELEVEHHPVVLLRLLQRMSWYGNHLGELLLQLPYFEPPA